MKDTTTPIEDNGSASSPDSLENLFRHADVRPRPPADDEARVRAALHAEWRQLAQRQRRRRVGIYAAAATVVLVLPLALFMPAERPASPSGPLATVARQAGGVFLRAPGMPPGAERRLATQSLAAGEVLRTADGALLAVRWEDGASLRLDADTELRLVTGTEVELLRGQIYVDSGQGGGEGFSIRTPAGIVRHTGTQYMTTLAPRGVAVSVREGRVEIRSGNSGVAAGRGEQLTVSPDGEVHRQPVATHGSHWAWAEAATPPLQLDGMSALDFLQWAARETGQALAFEDEATRQLATQTMLHGTVSQAPTQALDLILQTSDLAHRVDGGTIQVYTRGATS